MLGWLVAKIFHYTLPYRPFLYASIGIIILWWGLFLYGHHIGRFHHEVKEVEYTHADIPSDFDGYQIVHISDLHMDGWHGHEEQLSQIVEHINQLQPDLIVFTGDLVSLNHHELDGLAPILCSLKARDGVMSVLGNHDYDPYERISERQRQQNVEKLMQRQRHELNWHLLANQHHIIHRGADSIAIIGVENQSCGAHNVIHRGRLSEAMQGTEHMFSILLSHDPSHWRAEVLGHTAIPLTLSGHTHAMQMRIIGFTPSKWVYPECDGRYDEGGQTLYVNIGLGGTMPMRIGATPEITRITLKKSR